MLPHRPALVAVVFLVINSAASAQQLEATRDVNLRKGPSPSSQIIRVVDSGTVVDSLMRRSGWDRVQLADSTKGWIDAHYLNLHSPGPATPELSGSTSASTKKKGGSSGVAPIDSGPTGTASTAGCGDHLWNHVYHPERLVVKQQCITVTGTIVDATSGSQPDGARHEADGDTHGWLKVDPAFTTMLNVANNGVQQGHLVFEIVCHYSVTQTDAKPACSGFTDHMPIPPVGSHVEVRGTYVQDKEHQHWHEIHPVSSITIKP